MLVTRTAAPTGKRRPRSRRGPLGRRPTRGQVEARQVVARVNAPLDGSRRIAVVCRKGGSGKTTTSLMLGHTFAANRRDRVIALDANPDAGSLGHRAGERTGKTLTNLLEDRDSLTRYAQLGRYVSETSTRLDVVASDNDPRISQRLGEQEYHLVIDILDPYYNLIIADTGTGILDAAVRGVLAEADQLVLVVPPALDGARVAAATLDWLDEHGYARLVGTAVAAINAVKGGSALDLDLDLVEEHFARRCSAVVRIPWDPALATGAATRLDELDPATRQAYLRLAAAVADQFCTPANPEARP
jgi:putative peptide zinc metalloprotease protein